MLPKIEIKFDSIKAMASELSRISGRDFDYVLRSEAASCLKIAALDDGRIASAEAIRQDVKSRAAARIEADTGELITFTRQQRVWFSPDDKSTFYMVFDDGLTRGWHLPDEKWNLFTKTLGLRNDWIKARTAELLARRGLERLAWLQMGDAIDMDLDAVAPAKPMRSDLARRARVNGQQYVHGFVSINDSGANYTFTVTTDATIAARRRGQSRLDRAIDQRLRGFAIACDKGVLTDFQRRAARWPGIFVN